ncbi:RAB3IP [Lepeophtheirus salmonis]|uniref:RAB3IP n=2 Tax=Lepeophtheirus salmonis TaxID=72036 RepID=A0A7R8CNP0_LEPSM|nr:guanine nucleotide exchange factor for Rab-3A-like [Lepeophtheirus salmonis]XP_040583601.1 guanine nucleotide exchange factor for Rab-3A-like [Lepeophtheirus salmonis]XP_040583602.1 guanine nucleotide exchange factor for Rab-3A-like [Lepeophtheirus salmonis]XP_040583603.1 guanine nucleotide exchange factor for Rab-3A-like [Lepeophtheirus salmonis]CAB4061110.1 RAB3IP [Lepeophtheirus salmonis]CAF2877365.1 RAB3IP [Lepeophtheirus salmonis]
MPDPKDSSQKLSPLSESKRHQQSNNTDTTENPGGAGVVLSINSLKSSKKMGNSSGPSETVVLTSNEEEPVSKLEIELSRAKIELQEKDEQIEKLAKVRDEIEAELRDLTASLFEEAHKMVREANIKQASAEKKVTETQMKMEGLTTEVQALKVMVLTSTPSAPNKHLHPQIDPKKNKTNCSVSSINGASFHLRNDSTTSSERDDSIHSLDIPFGAEQTFIIDPKLYLEYSLWKKDPSLDRSIHEFLERIYKEDFELACQFENKTLQKSLFRGIEENTLSIHPISKDQIETKECDLLKVKLPCQYRVRIENEELSFDISSLARNRIISVCDCLNYLRYVTQGLVKSSNEDVFTEIMQHRKKILLARLGFKSQS